MKIKIWLVIIFASGCFALSEEAQAAVPTYQAKGTFTSGTAALSVPVPVGYQDNDVFLLFIESANEAITTPSGWTQVANSPQFTGTAATAGGVRLAVFYKIVSGAQSNVSVADSGNHTAAIIANFRGVDTSSPIHLTAGSVNASATSAISTPSVTTTITDAMIINAIGLDKDLADTDTITTAPVNANLINLVERHDQTVASGVGGGIAFFTGEKASAGAVGSTTATADSATTHAYITIALKPAPEVPGISGSLGKTTDGWAGAIPVYGILTGGLSENDYPYARAKVDTLASQTFYADMAWDSGDNRYEGTIYPGSNYCMGCDDPKTYNGSFSVIVQLDNNAGFPSVDYSASAGTFTTAITLKRSSMDNAQNTNYTDFNAIWSTNHWNISISDFGFAMNTGSGTNIAVAVPIHPITSSPSNFAVAFNGSSVSGGSAESTANAWWYDSNSHTLYLQFASLTTTLVDVDIAFDNDTDLFATRYNWVYTYDMGSRKFSNGLYIANQYLTTFVYGKPFSTADNNVACSGNECEGAGMQAESRAHHTTGGADESTDCMERIAVHVDDTPRSDGSGSYNYDIKWKQTEWASYITSEDNDQIVIINNSDNTASTGWAQQLNNNIAAKRTQTYYSGKRYIKNVYEFTNNDSVSHKYPVVWEREQWHGTDRATNDHGRFYGDSSDRVMEERVSMSSFSCPWQTVYDSGTYINMGIIYDQNNLVDYGVFAVEAFLASTAAEWPINITDVHATQTADQTGFEKTFSSVGAGQTASFTFWHVHNAESSWANIASAMDADCAEVNSAAPIISLTISDGAVAYGYVAAAADTTGGGGDTQTVTNNGNVAEDFEIVGQNSADWTLGASAGDAIYKHAWCVSNCDSSPIWNALTTAYQSLATNIAASGTQDFDLQVTVPASNAGNNQQNVNVTIRAIQH